MMRTGPFWKILVAVFVIIGLLATIITAAWVLRGQFSKTYPVIVHVNDAGGVEKGAPVELGGVRIGRVSEKPRFKKDYTALLVPLEIDEGVTIPEGSLVLIDTSDDYDGSFLKIGLPKEEPEKFVQANDFLNGFRVDRDELRQKSMGDSLAQFQKSMESLSTTSATLDRLISLLEGSGSLSPVPAGGSLSSINQSMEAFEKTNVKMSSTIDRLDALLERTGEGMVKVDNSIKNFDRTMAEFDQMADSGDKSFSKIYELADQNTETTKDFHLAVNDFRGVMADVGPLVTAVKEGEGLLKTLVQDEELRDDVSQFADKLEKNGILFYPREKKWQQCLTKSSPGQHRLMGRRR